MYETNITKLTDGQRMLFAGICAISKANKSIIVILPLEKLKEVAKKRDVIQLFLSLRYKKSISFVENADINVFSEIRLMDDTKEVAFIFTDSFYKILRETPYDEIEEYMSLTGKYAHYLYKIITRLKYNGYFEISVDDFCVLMNVPKSYNTSELSRVVITPAVNKLSRLKRFEGLKYGYYTGRNKRAQKIIFEWEGKDI